jgi:hypothetical protein
MGQRRFSGRSSVDTVAARAKVGIPSISFSKAALKKANIGTIMMSLHKDVVGETLVWKD